MSRWNPDARGRLEHAAVALFRERGYEKTTVADIAERAGLTERTFFRHFADKREVLFSGSTLLRDKLVESVHSLPPGLSPIDVVATAVEAISAVMHGRRQLARERQTIVAAHPDLQERDLIKRATLTATLANALKERGTAEPAASLAAEMGMTVFYVGFGHWLDDAAQRELVDIVREDFHRLRDIAAGAR